MRANLEKVRNENGKKCFTKSSEHYVLRAKKIGGCSPLEQQVLSSGDSELELEVEDFRSDADTTEWVADKETEKEEVGSRFEQKKIRAVSNFEKLVSRGPKGSGKERIYQQKIWLKLRSGHEGKVASI